MTHIEKNYPNLKMARSIVASFLVNVKTHPEYLTWEEWGSKTCERNWKVAKAMLAIDELSKIL